MELKKLISILESHKNQKNIDGMAHFGINPDKALGITTSTIKELAKEIGTDHQLALELWDTGIHEARWLAPLIADKKQINDEMLDKWVHDLNSWDICDNLMTKYARFSPNTFALIDKWQASEEEFVRRAAFALIAFVAVHFKKHDDKELLHFFDMIIAHAGDERNMVKKAVNWALRGLGKRSLFLREKALFAANAILDKYKDSKSARWISYDAIRELNSEKIIARLQDKEAKKATKSK